MADDPKSLTQQANYEILKKNREEMEKIKTSLKEINSLEQQELIIQEKIKSIKEQIEAIDKTTLEGRIKAFNLTSESEELETKLAEIPMQHAINLEKLNKLKERYGEISEDNLEKALEALKLEEERLGVMNETIGAIKGMTKNWGDFGSAVGKIGDAFTKAGKDRTNFMKMGQSIAKLGKEGGMINKFGNTFTKVFSGMSVSALAFVGIAGMVVGKVFSMAFEMDNLSKSFNKATGFAGDINDSLAEVTQQTNLMGATAQDAQKAFLSLASGLSSFDPALKATNQNLAKTIITLEKFGVANQTATESINFLEKGMGMSTNAARKMTLQIATMGLESNITMTQMMDNFNAAKDRISMFGSSSTRVLRDLSIQAKASGMSISSLLGVTKKFDTFESAAESVAQLNSVLGTNLSSMQMLEMDDAQRIEMLRKEIKARVGNFQALDKHTKMYIQNALGVQSVAEAQKLIDMNPQQYDAYNTKLAESADMQKQLAESAEKLVPIGQKLTLAFNQLLMQLQPYALGIVKAISKLLEFKQVIVPVISFVTTLATLFGVFVVVAKAVAFVMGLMGAGALVLSTPVLGTVAAIGALIAILASLWSWFTITGSPAMWEMPKVMAENFGIMGDMAGNLAKALLNPVDSLKSLWDIFHKEGSPELYKLPQEFADNFASIEESIAGTMGSITNFISVMKEFASLDYNGFVAVRSDGGSTSMVMGSEGIIKQMSEGRLTVDVNMPEIKMPPININVTFNDNRLKDLINVEISKKIGRAL